MKKSIVNINNKKKNELRTLIKDSVKESLTENNIIKDSIKEGLIESKIELIAVENELEKKGLLNNKSTEITAILDAKLNRHYKFNILIILIILILSFSGNLNSGFIPILLNLIGF